jgi:uncharacterized ParB-like nuclease family protein
MKLLMEQWRKYLDEIEVHDSLSHSDFKDQTGNSQGPSGFILWAKEGVDKVNTERISYDGLELQTAVMEDATKIIAYIEGKPVAYVSYGAVSNLKGEPFSGIDGVMIQTSAVADGPPLENHRGEGIAKKLYAYLIEKYTLFSGASQTPESKGFWNSLRTDKDKNYNVRAMDVETKEEVPVEDSVVYTKEGDDPNNIYLFIPKGGQAEDWRETSWTGADDEKVDIGQVVDYLGDNVVELNVSELSSQLPSLPTQGAERIAAASLDHPVIVVKSGGQYKYILDGNHRLQKAIDTEEETIKAKVLDLDNPETPEVFKRMFGGAA